MEGFKSFVEENLYWISPGLMLGAFVVASVIAYKKEKVEHEEERGEVTHRRFKRP